MRAPVSALPGASHRADPAARSAAGVEEVALVRLEAGDLGPLRHRQLGEHGAGLGIDPPDLRLGILPGCVPELSVDPGDTGDEAVRLDRAEDRAGRRVDLVDLPLAVLADPQRS